MGNVLEEVEGGEGEGGAYNNLEQVAASFSLSFSLSYL